MALSVNIEKKLGDFHLKVNFDTENEVISLLGASGCGKSMTLKCIAGIEKPDRGRIVLDGVTLFDSEKKINVSPQKRKVGYLFQQYALFPNMTVEQNIACGVRDKKRERELVETMIQKMNLSGMEKKKPHQLSGGQQQRVALARILANEPKVLLLDEPFSALDTYLRFQLEREVQSLIREFGKTVVLVSHDRDEVFRLTDSIAIMKDGKLETVGDKKSVFSSPQTKTGAILTGCKNISRIEILDEGYIYAKEWGISLRVPAITSEIKYVGMRLHDLKIGDETEENTVVCKVMDEIENPFSYTVILSPSKREGKNQFGIQLEKEMWNKERGEELKVHFPSDAILLLKE